MPNEVKLRIHRDEHGDVHPIEGISPMLAIPVKIAPMTYGQSRTYESFGSALDDWSVADKIKIINDHVVEPEIQIESEDDFYDNFEAWTILDLLQAIFFYSGMGRLYGTETAAGNLPSEDSETDQEK